MSFDDHPESPLQIVHVSHTDGFSHQSRNAVAPLVVQAFDDAGFAAAFVAWPVLPGFEPFGVGFIEVCINQFAPIISGQGKPQAHKAFGAAVANSKADDLARDARNGQPQVFVAPLETIADYQLINFKSVAFDARQDRVGKVQACGLRLFLSILRTVVRATRKVRAMARCEERSCKARAIKASFSALKARLTGLGVHVLPHSWQRRR